MLAAIDEAERALVAQLLVDARRHRHAAGRAQALEPRGDIDAVAVDAVGVHQHVAQVDADAKLHAPLGGQRGIGGRHRALDLERAVDRLDHRGEFREDRIARRIDDPAPVGGDPLPEEPAPAGERRVGGLLIRLHQAAVAHHVGAQDSR